ncbi:gliding motility-associated protein GldE [Xanthocytophaga flava]|uniref:gliding motility-associated protein GldE n=1 Tax=Xanthocytophaga flava TaxID=3048013 RepID=UPI0028D56568|nr:gliding motility-associated protein GldE [Xanthocytophaga flavus]
MENSTDTDDPLSYGVFAFNIASTLSAFYVSTVVLLILFLFLSSLFSNVETLFSSLTNTNQKNDLRSSLSLPPFLNHLFSKSKHLLAVLVLANYLLTIALSILLIYVVWYTQGSYAIGIFTKIVLIFLISFVVIFFEEVLPKIYKWNKSPLGKATSYIILIAYCLLFPFVWLLLKITHYIEVSLHKKGYKISADELTHVLETDTSSTTENEKQFLQGIVNFSTIPSKQIMRPRLDITAFPMGLDFHELMDKINKSGYSRVPIYNDTIDEIAGILYIKDLLPYLDKDEYFDWKHFLRTPYFITENKRIDDLLYDFQIRRVHIAIVVDEYGGTSGLITMEDIIEEILGDIQDEFDEEEKSFTQIDTNTYVFESKTLLNDFFKILEIDSEIFDEVRGDSESLGGLLLELFTRLPLAGEKVRYKDWIFSVLSADTKRIKRIKVTIETES